MVYKTDLQQEIPELCSFNCLTSLWHRKEKQSQLFLLSLTLFQSVLLKSSRIVVVLHLRAKRSRSQKDQDQLENAKKSKHGLKICCGGKQRVCLTVTHALLLR